MITAASFSYVFGNTLPGLIQVQPMRRSDKTVTAAPVGPGSSDGGKLGAGRLLRQTREGFGKRSIGGGVSKKEQPASGIGGNRADAGGRRNHCSGPRPGGIGGREIYALGGCALTDGHSVVAGGVVVSYFSGVVVAYFNGMLVFRQGAGGEQVRVVKLALGEVVVHQRTDGEHGKSHQRHQCGSKPPCT